LNRTIKEATVQRYHYESHDQLRTHLGDFIAACNLVKRLKTLGGSLFASSAVDAGKKNPADLLSIRSIKCRD
jgi:hypothetical protein